MIEWISHFHCPECEQCIDISGKDLVSIFDSTIDGDDSAIHVYKCPICGRTAVVAVERKGDNWSFRKILRTE